MALISVSGNKLEIEKTERGSKIEKKKKKRILDSYIFQIS